MILFVYLKIKRAVGQCLVVYYEDDVREKDGKRGDFCTRGCCWARARTAVPLLRLSHVQLALSQTSKKAAAYTNEQRSIGIHQ